MKIREVDIKQDNKRLFKVPSSSESGTYYDVERLVTISNTIVFKCSCIGYTTRGRANPFYECRHIREIKSYLGDTDENKK